MKLSLNNIFIAFSIILFVGSFARGQAQLSESWDSGNSIPTSSSSAPSAPTNYLAASATWTLSSADTTSVTTSGFVTGQVEAFSDMVINNYAGPNSSQRVTTTTGSWPTETNQNETRYIQFAVSPNSTYDFTVTSVTLSLGASGGSNMKANIWYSTDPTFTVRTLLNSSVLSLPNGSLSSLSYSPSVNVNGGQTFYLRIYPWYTSIATGKYVCPQNVVISGTTSPATPLITTSVSSLSSFSQTVGIPSASQTYTVSGSNLTNDVVVTAPVNLEISTNNGSTWNNNSSPITLSQSGGVLPGQPVIISVRMNSSSAAVYSDNIIHTSTGATTKNVAVSGTALATEPTVQSSVTFETVTDVSIVINFSGGNGAKRVVAARLGSAVTWAPTDGNAVTGVNSNFTTAADQGSGNKVAYDGTGSTVTMTGLSQNTTYYFAVYEYNVGTGNTQNYLTTSPGTGNQTTLAVATISVTPTSLSFGSVTIDSTSVEKTYSLSGTTLTPASGSITVSAPTGFEVSKTSGRGYASSVQVPYTDGALSATTIYARFKPTAVQSYSGDITNSGGGATTKNVAVLGYGVAPPAPNEFQAKDAILVSSYIRTQYPGYTGRGYVDMADKTGSSVEFIFRRVTAATDTVTIFFANGGSSRSLTVSLNDVNVATPSFPGTGSWSNWSSLKITVALQAGLNRLRFTLMTNGSGPNLDKIVIGGQAATAMYKLTLTKSGSGTVSANPAATYYEAGTMVTLTATPAGGNVFYRWGGTDESTLNPFILTVNSHKTKIGIMTSSAGFGSFPYQANPIGFAAVGAFGYPNGTTGGTGADERIEYVTNSTDLMNIMFRRVDPNRTLNFPPLTVYVIGTLTAEAGVAPMLDVKDLYDVSIIGVGTDATITGFGLSIVRSKNVIVRNIKIMNSPDDGIAIKGDDIEGTGNHIWIDHCTFTNCYDGALDVTHTASYVTISWNYLYNHDKTSLQGHSDSQTSDVAMKATWHHNYFDSTGQRHPRVRYGKAHVYNNYYRKNYLYGVSSNCEADVVVEGNYFLNVPIPFESLRVGTNFPSDIVERNNILAGTTGAGSTRGTAFDPTTFYSYTVDPAADIPAMLTAYAGSGKYDFSAGYTTTTFTLSVNAVNGTVTRNPSQAVYDSGTTVQLTAVPETGYHFVNWSGDLSGSDNPSLIIMNSNKNVTANFPINQCTIIYVSPTGDDTNPGTIDLPFKTIPKAVSVAVAGDTIYIRGGTHTYVTTISISKSGTSSSRFYMFAYAGERPLLDFSGMAVADANRGISLSGSYWHIKGLDIKGAGDNGMHMRGSNNIIEFCSFFENRDTGLQLSNGASNNQVINCDSYYNADPAEGNADGFAPKLDVDTGNYFYGCRAWQNSDDGYDGYLRPANDITTTYENCWAFKNGYRKNGTASTGNGNGFKMGGSDDKTLMHNVVMKNCFAFENRVKGFDQNNNKGSMTLYNCTGYSNGTNYSITQALNTGKILTVINCVALGAYGSIGSFAVQQTNSWLPPFNVTSADFVSTNSSSAYGPRKDDGSLPDITYMHLAVGSQLIDAGTNVGLPYFGTAPDLGAFEYDPSTDVVQDENIPAVFLLSQNFPNPFNATTKISFSVDKNEYTTLKIYNILGQEVATLFADIAEVGRKYVVEFNAMNLASGLSSKGGYASGVYFYKLQSDNKTNIKKLMLLK